MKLNAIAASYHVHSNIPEFDAHKIAIRHNAHRMDHCIYLDVSSGHTQAGIVCP